MNKILILSISCALAACGGGSGGSSGSNDNPGTDVSQQEQPEETFKPQSSTINSLALVDASGSPLVNAEVSIAPKTTSQAAKVQPLALTEDVQLTTDENGNLILTDMEAGNYVLTIRIAGVQVQSELTIHADNATESATVAAPIAVTEDGATSLEGKGIFASLSGVIHDSEGLIKNAQIEISGGAATNGAVATATTDENGQYILIVNVSLEKLVAMSSATLRIAREGYKTLSANFNLAQLSNANRVASLTGLNFELEAQAQAVSNIYEDDFEQNAAGAVCGAWTSAEAGVITFDPDFPEVVEDSETLLNLWHSHQGGLAIQNQAFVENLVKLAPDDTSNAMIPDPKDNRACWYGKSEEGNVAQGNFLGEAENNGGDVQGGEELDGGTSENANAGAIVSPLIDLTAEASPLALTFDNWWEIEAVNPNENGFDLMVIAVSNDNGENWQDIARLNPLTDPVTGLDEEDFNGEEPHPRAALPYSNRGFNKAPAWLQQEPISLSEFAGETIKLRLSFHTNDELYNGFRGWLVDNVRIFKGEGSFPRYRAPALPSDYLLISQNSGFDLETSTLSYSGTYLNEQAAEIKLLKISATGTVEVLTQQAVTLDSEFNLSHVIDNPNANDGTVYVAQVFLINDPVAILSQSLWPEPGEEVAPEED